MTKTKLESSTMLAVLIKNRKVYCVISHNLQTECRLGVSQAVTWWLQSIDHWPAETYGLIYNWPVPARVCLLGSCLSAHALWAAPHTEGWPPLSSPAAQPSFDPSIQPQPLVQHPQHTQMPPYLSYTWTMVIHRWHNKHKSEESMIVMLNPAQRFRHIPHLNQITQKHDLIKPVS